MGMPDEFVVVDIAKACKHIEEQAYELVREA
jgi:hypothetical protein